MTKRRGATSDNGFISKKINENENIKEKKKIWAMANPANQPIF
jgi:hypothetical protein